MKKIIVMVLALIMVASSFMLLASCNTGTTTTAATTTEEVKTTAAPATEATTTEAVVTTEETTTEETTTETTTEETTTEEETLLAPIFARFDFGTKTYAEDQGLTSHEYLLENMSYNDNALKIEFTEDSWIITVVGATGGSYASGSFNNLSCGIAFNNMITYDFDDQLIAGWGTWSGYPYSDKNVGTTWQGHYQFMKIRLINHSRNNMIGFRFRTSKDGNYATTCVVSNMYLQDGVSKTQAKAVSDTYASYTYDVMYLTSLASGKVPDANSYTSLVNYVNKNGGVPGNNWMWGNGLEVVSLEFCLLGAYSSNLASVCDSRSNIAKGAWVEVDYIVFGGTAEQLDEYKSYLEINA